MSRARARFVSRITAGERIYMITIIALHCSLQLKMMSCYIDWTIRSIVEVPNREEESVSFLSSLYLSFFLYFRLCLSLFRSFESKAFNRDCG